MRLYLNGIVVLLILMTESLHDASNGLYIGKLSKDVVELMTMVS